MHVMRINDAYVDLKMCEYDIHDFHIKYVLGYLLLPYHNAFVSYR